MRTKPKQTNRSTFSSFVWSTPETPENGVFSGTCPLGLPWRRGPASAPPRLKTARTAGEKAQYFAAVNAGIFRPHGCRSRLRVMKSRKASRALSGRGLGLRDFIHQHLRPCLVPRVPTLRMALRSSGAPHAFDHGAVVFHRADQRQCGHRGAGQRVHIIAVARRQDVNAARPCFQFDPAMASARWPARHPGVPGATDRRERSQRLRP